MSLKNRLPALCPFVPSDLRDVEWDGRRGSTAAGSQHANAETPRLDAISLVTAVVCMVGLEATVDWDPGGTGEDAPGQVLELGRYSTRRCPPQPDLITVLSAFKSSPSRTLAGAPEHTASCFLFPSANLHV